MPVKRSAKSVSKSTGDDEPIEITNWIDKMHKAFDDLSESRTSTREESLEIIVNVFACHRVFDHIESRLEEILALFKKSLMRNSSTKEACLAARAIALTFINLEDLSESEGDDLYRKILKPLRSRIKDCEDIDIKVNSLQTLALITYIAASDIDKQLVREYIFDLIETDGAEFSVDELSPHDMDRLLFEATRAYGLLYAASFTSGFVDFEVLWEEVEKVMPVHEIMLESTDKDNRIASGENIALMFETVNIFLAADDEEDEEEDGMVKPEYDNMDGLIHTLKGLSLDSNRHRAKSDRAEQKSVFRDIVKSVEENIKPVEELKINGRVLTFRGWAKILPLNAFRRCLGQGFQYHVKANPMMKEIFRYSTGFSSRHQLDSDDDSGDEIGFSKSSLSNVDKKYIYDENKKARTKQIRSARLGKEDLPVY